MLTIQEILGYFLIGIIGMVKAFKEGRLEAKSAVHTPNNALSLYAQFILKT